MAHAVHRIVPVPGAEQRQPVRPLGDAVLQCPHAMLEKVVGFLTDFRLEESIMIVRTKRLAFEERHGFVKHPDVAGEGDVPRCAVGQPHRIVRYARANALSRPRQPPMLDIALPKLP